MELRKATQFVVLRLLTYKTYINDDPAHVRTRPTARTKEEMGLQDVGFITTVAYWKVKNNVLLVAVLRHGDHVFNGFV